MPLILPLLMDKRWELKLNLVTKSSQDSPLSERSGPRVFVEVELHDLTPPHQVGFQFIFESQPFIHLQVDAEIHVAAREGDERDQNSEEAETEV